MSSPTTRTVHPLAWWAWGIGCVVAANQAETLLALLGLAAGVVTVGFAARNASPWARALEASLVLAGIVVVVRVGFYVLIGLPDSSRVVVSLPAVHLPEWLNNMTLLGPVHAAGLTGALTDGVALGLLIVVFGAVNAIAHPRLALASLPTSLHHLGTAAVIAVSATPQLFTAAARVRRAQKLRGGAPKGMRAMTSVALPVLAGALDQALALAASMDSRGYARARSGHSALVSAAITLALLAAVAGTYGLLDPLAPQALAIGLLAGGLVVGIAASYLASRSVQRTRYRRHPWGGRESMVTACGVLVGAGAVVMAELGAAASTTWPTALVTAAALGALAASPLTVRRRA